MDKDNDKTIKLVKGSSQKPTLFVSYCQDDKEWKKLLEPHLKALVLAEHIILWDDSKINIGADWYPEIQEALERADAAICLLTPNFLASDFIIKEEIPFLLKKRQDEGMLLVPILISPCPWKSIPWLKGIQMYTYNKLSIAEIRDTVEQAKAFSEIANFVCDNIRLICTPSETFQTIIQSDTSMKTASVFTYESQVLVDIDRLPVTGAELFGRQKEMELLDEAWDKHNLNAISFVAWGGVGKSTLINKWLESMKTDNYRGATRVYGWSFYSQGTGERTTSADLFIAEALKWFGDPDQKEGSLWDKGQRLADLVRKEKTLLILDGLEPLQSAHDFEKGKIKDAALSVLVNALSRENPGLLIITTREEIAELKELTDHVVQKNLEQITPEAGRALLRTAGVRGVDKELEDVSRSFGNHALALRLLGSYLYDKEGHSISYASDIPGLEHIPDDKGRHPRRVMAAFEERFGEGPEVELLRMLGLFDRPAEQGAIEALLRGKTISHLTKQIRKLGITGQKDLIAKLRDLNLIAKASHHDRGKIDSHPLVREHFGEQLKTDYPTAWKEAHSRLYEYFKKQARELPDTIDEMSQLYSAVAHGCAAGRHQEVGHDVYWKRIRRGKDNFSLDKLGAFGSDLACLSHFFEIPWRTPVAGLSEDYKAAILGWAGFCLRALGRLKETAEPMQAGLEMRITQEKWENAAIAANNLSELFLAVGDVGKATEYAGKSVEYADRSGDVFEKMSDRATLANAFFHAGRVEEAENLFNEADEMQKKRQPEYPYLYSLPGFQYCELLLEKAKYQQVLKRSEQILEWAHQSSGVSLLDTAIIHLSLGRIYLLKALKENNKDYTETEKHLNKAVDGLRNSGIQSELPLGLLARAELYRIKKEFNKAEHDLDEAMTIAIRGGMELHEADCHLGYARFYLAMDEKAKARKEFSTAKEMINAMGYHRRDKDVQELEEKLQPN